MVIFVAGGAAVRKCTVGGYFYDMVHIHVRVEASDPRLDHLGRVDFCLGQKLCAKYWANLPPTHVHPNLITLLHECHLCLHEGDTRHCAIADLLFVVFFFLFRPGEYCRGRGDTCLSPFRLCGLQFSVGIRTLRTSGAPLSNLQ